MKRFILILLTAMAIFSALGLSSCVVEEGHDHDHDHDHHEHHDDDHDWH